MFSRTDNPVRDFERWDDEREAELEKLPKCAKCEQPIQSEELYDIDGRLYHEHCMVKLFRKWTDDYIE